MDQISTATLFWLFVPMTTVIVLSMLGWLYHKLGVGGTGSADNGEQP